MEDGHADKSAQQGPLCISTGIGIIPAGQSEDCLYLAVYAPTAATPASKLPVFVFIQGGGFNANSNPNLNGTGLIEASGHNIVVVTFNYRVGPWGFLASSSSAAGLPVANNGLRDQRKALEWVNKYISAFGGDPNHVVLGGDSAGAASIALHMTAYGGRNDNLFHAAAAESVSFAPILTPSESQYQYNALARAAGCSQTGSAESLKCLRSKSAAVIEAHNYNIPYPRQTRPPLFMFNPTLDGDFVTDLTYNALTQGKFVDIPLIVGDDTNGGTIFTPRDTRSQEDSDRFLTSQFPDLSTPQLAEINNLYPKPDQCPLHRCWWRQVSNAYGEMRYMCPSLYVSSAMANSSSLGASEHEVTALPSDAASRILGRGSTLGQRPDLAKEEMDKSLLVRSMSTAGGKSWAYRYDVEDPDQMAQGLGVPHTVELNAIFGPTNVPPGAAPASYFKFKSNENVVPVIQAYWTSFIRTFDPNTYKLNYSARWDGYYNQNGQPQRLVFQDAGLTQMETLDPGLRQRCAYLQSIGPIIRQRL